MRDIEKHTLRVGALLGDFDGEREGLSVSGLDPQDPNEVDVELPNAPAVKAVLPSTVTPTEPDP